MIGKEDKKYKQYADIQNLLVAVDERPKIINLPSDGKYNIIYEENPLY